MRAEADKRALLVLSGGHAATDFANGSLPALLPFLVDRFSLTYTLAALLMLASTLSSSVIQPVFGAMSDRFGAIWLLPSGIALAGIGIAVAANVGTYALVFLAVLVSGIGIASYHPEAAKFAAYASGRKRASGMSVFSIGGNVGYALGPIVATPLVLWLGLRGAALLVVPPLLASALLVRLLPYLRSFAPVQGALAAARGETQRRALALLLAVIAFRSVAWFGLVTFVPLWEIAQGHSKAEGNKLLAIMLVCGGIGTLLLGPAADRFGRRAVILATLAPQPALILGFLLVGGIPGAVSLALIGILVQGTFAITAVMAKEYMPSRVGMASGLSIGFAIGIGGVAAVVLGAVADALDLRTALYIVAATPALTLALGALLPAAQARRGLAAELAPP